VSCREKSPKTTQQHLHWI